MDHEILCSRNWDFEGCLRRGSLCLSMHVAVVYRQFSARAHCGILCTKEAIAAEWVLWGASVSLPIAIESQACLRRSQRQHLCFHTLNLQSPKLNNSFLPSSQSYLASLPPGNQQLCLLSDKHLKIILGLMRWPSRCECFRCKTSEFEPTASVSKAMTQWIVCSHNP